VHKSRGETLHFSTTSHFVVEERLAPYWQRTHNSILTLSFSWKVPLAKILIVDDDGAVRATIKLLLERAGHSVAVAGDGHNGLAIFEAGEFDLLFMDIFMPGMDGLETMRLVHQTQPLIPIIVISGRPIGSGPGADPDFLTMAIKLGAITTLQKPFKPAALLAAVAACLEATKRRSSSAISACNVASGP
jgi:CheY-like chemotaxis protein